MELLKKYIEKYTFGVCTWLGEKMGIDSSRIRIFFIYSTFLTLGSPVFIYLGLAFILNLKNYIKNRKHPIWDL